MRHQKKKLTLDRKTGPRRALLKHLAESFVLYEKIVTTKTKAKAAQSFVERLITVAKGPNKLTARRSLISKLGNENAAKKLIEVLGPRYADRKGGYTRVTVIKNRKGDGAEEALAEFI